VNDRGVIFIAIIFMILITATVIAVAYAFLITQEMKSGGIELNEQKALYIAETGIERTMEFLEDDTDWSDNDGTAVINESFGAGSYSIDLSDGTRAGIVVTSEATVAVGPRQVKRKISQKIRRLPEAFNYALFWEGAGTLSINGGLVVVNGGDVFTKNTISSDLSGIINVIDGGTPAVTNGGFVYTTSSWTAGGTFTEGVKPDDEPAYPVLDTTFYDSEITVAEAQTIGDLTLTGGSQVLSGTTYVNGLITIDGTTITGNGAFVATGKINIIGSASITPDSDKSIRLISKTDVTIENSTTGTGTVVYARSESEIDNATLRGSFISVDKVKIINASTVTGYLYTDTLDMRENATVNGSIVTNRFAGNKMSNKNKIITINFDHSYLEDAAPGLGLDIDGDGNEEGIIVKVPGTWRQL
jgi:hypothetical protein